MSGKPDGHLDEEIVERYSMNRLASKAVRQVEEHLLVCARCRRAVSAADAHIAAMRTAAAQLRGKISKPTRKKAARKAIAKS